MVIVSQSANAWVSASNASVLKVIQFEEGIGRNYTVATISDGTKTFTCYVAYNEKLVTTSLLALYMTGKTATIHCHDTPLDIGGFSSHKLHRLIAG
jgi:hypothetical protein